MSEDGLYSVAGVAAKIGVTPGFVRNWVTTGLLPTAVKGGTIKGNWFRLDEALVQKLLEAKNKRITPNKIFDKSHKQ